MNARSIRVRGIVQGVGFRPFVFRLARANTLGGWVLNGDEGVEIFVEGPERGVEAFVQELKTSAPPAARIATIEIEESDPEGFAEFTIVSSRHERRPTVRIAPDLPICDACLRELFDPADPRHRYPYINCTNCGPRYSVIEELPYDRRNTTMKSWPLDDSCSREYGDPSNRRFHAEPVACPNCGPGYFLRVGEQTTTGSDESIRKSAELLSAGKIAAVKGLGGYHLACDARNSHAVAELRKRKFRKEKPFALMVPNLEIARRVVELTEEEIALLTSSARPIVIARAKCDLEGIAPGSTEFGIMLPYTPLHYLLFDAGAPEVLVMTSANRSSEPLAYLDEDAEHKLAGIADAFLVGERPIARRVDDSVVRSGVFGPMILRRSRGYAPQAVATLPADGPILALGADLKNSVSLVVDGQAFVSQHTGDLSDYRCFQSFVETIDDLLSMYEVNRDDLMVVHDSHPEYLSTAYAAQFHSRVRSVQHHRAHIASVLAERHAFEKQVVGVSCDGTGYGDDGTIWGGEIFAGSLKDGFERVAHLRPALLPGGDAAAQYPVQAAAGFLLDLEDLPDLSVLPFRFPARYAAARSLAQSGVRTFTTTSAGRLFDAAAALLGFVQETTFEGQAACWLEQLARRAGSEAWVDGYAFPFAGDDLDFRPLLAAIIEDRLRGRPVAEIARAFQRGFAQGIANAVCHSCEIHRMDTAVLSGGVFQNELLLEDLNELLGPTGIVIWTNREVPPNDGGISLGQAALAVFSPCIHEISRNAHA